MDRRYSKKGLKIIAPEMQGIATEAIQKIVDKERVKYTVTKGIMGPATGAGFPGMAVFDTSGKLVWAGPPDKAEDAIKDALKSAKPAEEKESSGLGDRKFLIEERAWTNAEGKQMVAAVVSVIGSTVKFRFSNGQVFDYDLSKLSAEDQKTIKESTGGVAGE